MIWCRFCACLCTFGMLVGLNGCSGGGSDPMIKGQVNFDGQPLTQARVTFEGDKSLANAMTDDAGKFEIAITGPYALQPGSYLVTVSKFTDKKGNVPAPEEVEQLIAAGQAKNLVPFKYGNRANTPFTGVEIKKGLNELPPFELKSK
jgi:hypothetical protein